MTFKSTDYALLAQDSYNHRDPRKEVVLGGVEYKIFDRADNPRTGFQATAYQRTDTGEVVIAYRGTEFDREPLRDGGVDAGMALAGVNAQGGDAKAFTQRVLSHAKADAQENGKPFNVTVTGHSLGGTLAQLEAHKFGLKGETFNAYGAAGLIHGVPAGGHQVINHVRAGDVVSAASSHFGEVRVYAVQQDINTLGKAGYRDGGGALSVRNPFKATDFDAHAIDNFVPHNKMLGETIMSAKNVASYKAHHEMIDRYRSDVHHARAIVSVPLQTGIQAGQAIGHGANAVGHAAGQAYDAARERVESGARRAGEALDRAGGAVREGSSRILEKVGHPGSWFSSMNQPEHPGNGHYRQSLAGMEKINAERGIASDHRTCNAAGALASAACQAGFKQVDHVVLGNDGSNLIAVQGALGSAHSKVTQVATLQAMNTPLEDSSNNYLQAMNKAAQPDVAVAHQIQQQQRTNLSV
ncbi:hypothetical protein GN316_16640 [Xylophilus sp. Kf1]|nr:hypothetical protein [Xylophilus sp. Kf1]